jgi:O-antigen/teichoic acid export membrane protein
MTITETPKAMLLREIFPWLSDATRVQITEYAPTFLTEFAVMASQIVVYKLAAHYLGNQGFSEYAVARRAISTIYPVGLLGLGVALPRYIAISAGDDEAGLRDRFFGATLWCVGVSAAIIVGLISLMPSGFAYLIYGNNSYRSLARPIGMVIAGLLLHALAYSYFRGHLHMARANILQLANLGVVPVLAFFVGFRSVGVVLERIGMLSIFVSLTALFFTPWKEIASGSFSEAKTLLRYGVPRVPADFAQMALFGLPAFVVAHRVGVQQAGNVAFSISALTIAGAIFAPVGLILLPKASRLIARGASEELERHVSLVLRLSLIVSILLTIAAEMFSGQLVRAYLGPGFSEISTVVRVVMLGAVPYAVYTVLRSAIDARHIEAINTKNNGIAFAIFIACSTFLLIIQDNSMVRLILPLPICLLILGILTWLDAKKVVLGSETPSVG